MKSVDRKLRVFLCHASQDKPIVRELYQRLLAEGWIDPWLDEEKLLPGQDWDMEIEKAVETADAVIVCLSNKSVTKEGYIQRELKFALDIALEKPEGTIFIIPVRLDECELPRRLRAYQYVDFFPFERANVAYSRLRISLELRANANRVFIENPGLLLKPQIVEKNDAGIEIFTPSLIWSSFNLAPQCIVTDASLAEETIELAYDKSVFISLKPDMVYSIRLFVPLLSGYYGGVRFTCKIRKNEKIKYQYITPIFTDGTLYDESGRVDVIP